MVKNGFVYVSGTFDGWYYGFGNEDRNSKVWKFDLDGHLKGMATYNNGSADYALDFTVDGQDNIYLSSQSQNLSTGLFDMATTKFGGDCLLVWTSRYNNNGTGNHQPASITVDVAGDVYVTGNSDGDGTTGKDIATIKYNGANGDQLWVDRYNGSANGDDTAGTVLVDIKGDVLVSGTSVNGGTGSDFTAIKYSADGTRQWDTLYGTNATETATSAALDQNGDFILTGSGTEASSVPQFLTVKFTDVINVALDIKPGSFPNSINPRNKGVIPVAVLTTDTFDAATVDATSVLFGATGTEVGANHYALEDVNGDGKADLVFQFPTLSTGIVCGTKTATIKGSTTLGQAFEGSDAIVTTGCK
jgi:hypothetical protein